MESNRWEEAEQAARFAASLCVYGKKDQAFYDSFWERLKNRPDIYEEFVYYMKKQDFLCRAKVAGRSIVDIMVWQMDHFKAHLDRDQEMRCNKDMLLLNAFDTMLQMAEDPEPALRKMESETGTDFPEKF